MFINQLRLVLRRLKRSPFYTLVNVLGLSVGLIAVLFISIYVYDELSYDRFHADEERIFRVYSSHERLGISGFLSSDYVEFFAPGIPEIESYTRLGHLAEEVLVTASSAQFNLEKVFMTDPGFFSFFSFKLTDGVANQVFSETNRAVITQSTSRLLFGDENPIGQEIVIEKDERYLISGLAEDPPHQSTIQFSVLLYKQGYFKNRYDEVYWVNTVPTFIKLSKKEAQAKVLEGIHEARQRPNYALFTKEKNYSLLPLAKERLDAPFKRDHFEHNASDVVNIFMAIGLSVLLLALINYVNLVTAQSMKRVKEVGLRKVIGARKGQLLLYQLIECTLLVMLSFLLAFAGVERLLPVFNEMLDKNLSLSSFALEFLFLGLIFSLLLGLIAGLYPAWYINRINPIVLMNKQVTHEGGGKRFKKGLVLFQFIATAILIVALVIMRQQMNYIKDKELGFNTEMVLSVPLVRDSTHLYQKLKSSAAQVPGVVDVGLAGFNLGGFAESNIYYSPNIEGRDTGGERVEAGSYDAIFSDAGALEALGFKFIWKSSNMEEGKFEGKQILVNHALAKKMGWLENPRGRRLYNRGDVQGYEVMGIVEDFHIKSLKEEIEPMMIFPLGDWGTNCVLVKLEAAALVDAKDQLAAIYHNLFDRPFSYEMLDQQVKDFYKEETGQFKLFQAFSSLALFISLLGLLALTTYTVQLRRKEISIRKVLGASLRGLVMMLNREYMGMVVLAFLVASPIAYFAMEEWLANFSYRIAINPLLFMLTFMGFITLCWLVTAGQSVKVSRENPADVLRDE